MPTYEYACKNCGEHLEAVQAFTDPALTTCPSCGGELRKVFGAVGIVFKGSGFYKTDSRSASTAASPAKSADAPAAASGGTDAPVAPAAPAKSETPAASTTTPAASTPASAAASA